MTSRIQSYPNQPTDDVLEEIRKIVELKRAGNFEIADDRYRILAQKEKDDSWNYPYVLKSWAKVHICLGNYDKAIALFVEAVRGFEKNDNDQETFQCNHHAMIIRNRNLDRDGFIEYVRSASGNALNYPRNF